MIIRHCSGVDTYSIIDFDIRTFPIKRVRERFPDGFDTINVHYGEECIPTMIHISQSWGNMESMLLEEKEDLAVIASFLMDYIQIHETMETRRN